MNTQKNRGYWIDPSYVPLAIGAVATFVAVYSIYFQTQSILKERLQQRIESMVSIAALEISPDDIRKIINEEARLSEALMAAQDGTTETFSLSMVQKNIAADPILKKHPIISVTNKMKRIREISPNVRYMYIWRKTDKPLTLAFVTDSDTVFPVDWDKNGKIDEIEIPPMPGEEYDISDLEIIEQQAFDQPLVLDDFLVDKWGTFLSGFAPITDAEGKTVAILGMDVEVGDFNTVVRATLLPLTLQGLLLLLLLSFQTFALLKIWKNRVQLIEEIDRQKDELLSMVSHQLAAPVTAIKWYIELLLDGDVGSLSKDQRTQINTMQNLTTNLSELISMILDVSRLQLGRMKVEKQEMSLPGLIDEILEVIKPKVTEKKVKFDYKNKLDKAEVKFDKRLTRMTIENLLTNAVKYTPEKGKVTLTLDEKKDMVQITVADTGIGIPKDEQDKIFGKLFRASNARDKIDGNGFGLFVAKGAIESQGGSISFTSEENKGTTFTVRLPRE